MNTKRTMTTKDLAEAGVCRIVMPKTAATKTERLAGSEFDAVGGYADVDSAEEEYRLRLADYKRTGSFRDKQAAVAALNALEEALCGHNPHTGKLTHGG